MRLSLSSIRRHTHINSKQQAANNSENMADSRVIRSLVLGNIRGRKRSNNMGIIAQLRQMSFVPLTHCLIHLFIAHLSVTYLILIFVKPYPKRIKLRQS